jgi:hypothetical protein
MCDIICSECDNEIDETGGLCECCNLDIRSELEELEYEVNWSGKMECPIFNCLFNNDQSMCKKPDSIEDTKQFDEDGYPILRCTRYLKHIRQAV